LRSLRRQLLVGLLVALAVTGVGVWLVVRRALGAQFDGALSAKGNLFATVIKDDPEKGVELDLDETPMPEFERRQEPEYYQVWLPDGRVLARSPSLGTAGLAPPARPGFWNLTLPDGRPGRGVTFTAAVRREEDDRRPGPPATPFVRVALARERGSLDAALTTVWSALALGGLLLLVGVPLLVGRALRPLDEVARHAACIDAHSLGLRFAGERLPDELRPVADRLNDLLGRLEASFERERRFSADVAHELRTPIAELRSIAEVALRYPDNPGRSFEDVLGAALQMEALVTALLTLARCDSGRQPVRLEPVDLTRLCREAWPAHERAAAARAVRTRHEGAAEITVDADPVLLGSVVHNLFANAVEYTPTGGEVLWQIERDGAEAVLVVTNSNFTLEAADLPHVFERFWRKDAARTGTTHGGLGLSVAEALVRLLHGRLRLELPRPDLVRVELRLPAQGAGKTS
jgi:two-component system sensor histidine kinase QseC